MNHEIQLGLLFHNKNDKPAASFLENNAHILKSTSPVDSKARIRHIYNQEREPVNECTTPRLQYMWGSPGFSDKEKAVLKVDVEENIPGYTFKDLLRVDGSLAENEIFYAVLRRSRIAQAVDTYNSAVVSGLAVNFYQLDEPLDKIKRRRYYAFATKDEQNYRPSLAQLFMKANDYLLDLHRYPIPLPFRE